MTLADEIRALLKAHGPLTAPELRALLPDRHRPDGTARRTTPREIHSRLHAMCQSVRCRRQGPILQKEPGDRYRLLRDPAPPPTPEERAERRRLVMQRYEAKRSAERKQQRHARGIVPIAKRALRIRDHARRREEITAEAAQAINRRLMGLRDVPAHERPCTESWLAANADKYEVLRPGAVSPASQFRKLANV